MLRGALIGLFLPLGGLFAQSVTDTLNVVQTNINIAMTVLPDSASQKVIVSVTQQAPQLGSNTTATLSVDQASVQKTLSELLSDGKVTIPITITATPDSLSTNGYVVSLQSLAVRVNLSYFTDTYFYFLNPQLSSEVPLKVTPGNKTLEALGFAQFCQSSTPLKLWFFPPQGVILSDGWDDQYLIDSKEVGKSESVTFEYQSDAEYITNLQAGTYFVFLTAAMSPRSLTITTAQENALVVAQLEIQKSVLQGYITNINTQIATGARLTSDQIANLRANKAFLEEEIKEIDQVIADKS
ncbi:MAG: hypothetical protein S4CHLAM102_14410 [Chlamydiia bacterium]|nr:hypothetical protein [Chlamydiia bacterium]